MTAWTFRALAGFPLLVIPVAMTGLTLDPVLVPRFILLSAFLGLVLGYFLITAKQSPDAGADRQVIRWFWLSAGYVLVSGISLLAYRDNFADGLFLWLMNWGFLAAVLAFYRLFRKVSGFIIHTTSLLVVLALVYNLYGCWQFFFRVLPEGYSHASSYLLNGFAANKNVFAEVLCLLLPFQALAALVLSGSWRRVATVNLGISAFLLAAGLSRSAWVSLALALLVMAIVLVREIRVERLKRPRIRRWIVSSVVLIAVLATLLAAAGRHAPESLLSKQLHSLSHPTYGSAKDRLLLWQKTLAMAGEKPLFGNGLGTWKVRIMKYGNENLKSADNMTFYQRPHNDYLWILSEQGIFALVLYLSLMGWLLIMAIRLTRVADRVKRLTGYCFLAFMVIYLSLSFFAFPRERVEHLVLLAVVAAVLLVLTGGPAKGGGRYLFPLLAVLVPLSFFSVYAGISRFKGEYGVKQAMKHRQGARWEAMIGELGNAEGPLYRMDAVSTPLSWYRGLALYNLGQQQEALRQFEKACLICPYHPHILNNLATCLVLLEDSARPEKLYEQAVALSPRFDEAWINLAVVRFNRGDPERALLAIRKADTATTVGIYRNTLFTILNRVMAGYLSGKKEPDLTHFVQRIFSDEVWLWNVYLKSIRENRDFTCQVLLDVLWMARAEQNEKLAVTVKRYLSLDYGKEI